MKIIGDKKSIDFIVLFNGVKTENTIQKRKINCLKLDQQQVIPFLLVRLGDGETFLFENFPGFFLKHNE